MTIRILTVEDSTLIRTMINDIIKEIEGVELIATAENGKVALPKIKDLAPDIVTLDVEMPIMGGLETLEKIREFSDVPVLMLSARTDQETTLRALEIGAQDFLAKPEYITRSRESFKKEIEEHIKALVKDNLKKPKKSRKIKQTKAQEKKQTQEVNKKLKNKRIDALVIGASTGGPKVLTEIVKALPENLSVPIFIVQHMPKEFTASFAKRLNTIANVPVAEAEHRMLIQDGHVYLAPSGYHMRIHRKRIVLSKDEKMHGVRPAVDPLFDSAVEKYGTNLLGVLLTGMGKDGAIGCLTIKQNGGYILAQDEESSVVYGMARHAVEKNAVNEVLAIDEIIKIIKEIVRT